MVTGKSLAQVLGKPTSVPTLDLLAFNLWGQEGIICPILNARKNEVYTALYEMQGQELVRLSEYMAISPLALAEKLKTMEKETRFLGDGVPVYKEILQKELDSQARWVPLLICFLGLFGFIRFKTIGKGTRR